MAVPRKRDLDISSKSTPSPHPICSHKPFRSVLERPALCDKFHLQNARGCREGTAELESAEVAAALGSGGRAQVCEGFGAGCHVLGRDELGGGRSSGL